MGGECLGGDWQGVSVREVNSRGVDSLIPGLSYQDTSGD